MMVMIRMDNAARIRGQAKKYRKEAQDLGLELKLIHYDEQISLVRYLKRHGLLTVRQIRALEYHDNFFVSSLRIWDKNLRCMYEFKEQMRR